MRGRVYLQGGMLFKEGPIGELVMEEKKIRIWQDH